MRLPPDIETEIRIIEQGTPRLRGLRSAIEVFMKENKLKHDSIAAEYTCDCMDCAIAGEATH